MQIYAPVSTRRTCRRNQRGPGSRAGARPGRPCRFYCSVYFSLGEQLLSPMKINSCVKSLAWHLTRLVRLPSEPIVPVHHAVTHNSTCQLYATDNASFDGDLCNDASLPESGVDVQCRNFDDGHHVVRLMLTGSEITGNLSDLDFNFTELEDLTVRKTKLHGSLPPKLTGKRLIRVEFDSNPLMTGSLPELWNESLPSVQTMILGPSQWQGSLPESWGRKTSFQGLRTLKIQGPSPSGTLLSSDSLGLTGQIPESWATPGSFPNLTVCHLAC